MPCFPFSTVRHTDGNEWFGSQYADGEIKDWWPQVVAGSIKIDDLKDALSRIYAFDLFIHNVDRHAGNYIVKAEGGTHRIFALDHGRSWMFGGFPPKPPPMGACATIAARDWMKVHFGKYQQTTAMLSTLEAIGNITVTEIEKIVNDQPIIWLDKSKREDIIAFWRDGEATKRLETIVNGIGDGSLL